MYSVVTLDEIKVWLNIQGDGQDDFLKHLQAAATAVVERYCGKRFITRRYIEDFDVEKSYVNKVIVTNYPIYLNSAGDNITVWNDSERNFTDSTKINRDDYVVDKEIGAIRLIRDYFSRGVGVVRVDYWAGYSRFVVLADSNDKFNLTEGGTTYTITVAVGTYNAEDLAAAIKAAIDAAGLANTYAVSYDHITQKFTISASGTFGLDFTVNDSLGILIGFSGSYDGKTVYEADRAVTGLPTSITMAALHIINRWWRLSAKGKGDFDLVREIMQDGGTREYAGGAIPESAAALLDNYKRALL